MKKLFVLLAISALLLAGCGAQNTGETIPTPTEQTQPAGAEQAVVPEEEDINIELG